MLPATKGFKICGGDYPVEKLLTTYTLKFKLTYPSKAEGDNRSVLLLVPEE